MVDDVLPALRRRQLRPELLGLAEDDIRRMTADLVAGSGRDTFPAVLSPVKPTGRDRRALISVIGDFSPAARRTVFKTPNMLAIRGMVTAGVTALEREGEGGGLTFEPPAALASASHSQPAGLVQVPDAAGQRTPDASSALVEEDVASSPAVRRAFWRSAAVGWLVAIAINAILFGILYLIATR